MADVVVGKLQGPVTKLQFFAVAHSTANPSSAAQTTALWSFEISFSPPPLDSPQQTLQSYLSRPFDSTIT